MSRHPTGQAALLRALHGARRAQRRAGRRLRSLVGLVLIALGIGVLPPLHDAAQGATLTRSLRDLGFRTGLVLRPEGASGVFLPVPRGAVLKGVTLETFGSGTAAGVTAGRLHWFVNGVPADALVLQPGVGRWTLGRRTVMRASGPAGTATLPSDTNGVEVRYAFDLREEAAQCQPDLLSNAFAIAPASRIHLDLDVSGVETMAGALGLLPMRTPIVLPAGERLSERAFAVALRLAAAVKASGREPLFVDERPKDALVALRILATEDAAREVEPVRLARPEPERFDILIDEDGDIDAFLALWAREPRFLAGQAAPALADDDRGSGPASVGQGFAALPPALSIGRRGEWTLPFEITSSGGRMPQAIDLALRVAPDWSEAQPILTVFLNEQLIDAKRLRTERLNAFSIDLPSDLLQQDNAVRVVVDRAPQPGPCARPAEGPPGQLVRGTGLRLGERAAMGFGAVTRNLDDGDVFRIRLTEAALARPAAIDNLTLLADVLAGLNADGSERLVVFAGLATGPNTAIDDLVLAPEDPEGLTLDLSREAALSGTLVFAAGAPLAALAADEGRLRLTTFPEAMTGYAPTRFDLRNGDLALLGPRGVVWQNGPSEEVAIVRHPAWLLLERLRDVAGRFALILSVGLVGVVLAVIGLRQTIARRAARRRAAATPKTGDAAAGS